MFNIYHKKNILEKLDIPFKAHSAHGFLFKEIKNMK
jgi:hypothetical protein